MTSEDIKNLIAAGCDLDIEPEYSQERIREFAFLAAQKGTHIRVAGGYSATDALDWARIGGKNFTYTIIPPMTPDEVKSLVEAECNVEIVFEYPTHEIYKWVNLAAQKGTHILVVGAYPSTDVLNWAIIGGKNFTYRVRMKPPPPPMD